MEASNERSQRTDGGDARRSIAPRSGADSRASSASRSRAVLPGWSEEDVLRRFAEVAEEIALVLDLDGRIVWAGGAAKSVFGPGVELCSDRTVFESLSAEHRALAASALERIRDRGATHVEPCELRHASRDGLEHLIRWSVRALGGADGRAAGFLCAGLDVTEQRSADSALRRSDARMSAVLASVYDPLVTIDAYGTILSASDSLERMFGYAPAELVGRNVRILMPEPYRSAHDGYLAHYRSTNETGIIGRTREFEVLRRDGTPFWCALSVSRADPSDGQDAVFTGTFRDVTELKRATQALEQSERRFHAVFDGTFQMIGILAPDGAVIDMNQTALDAIGAHRSDVVGTSFADTRWWSHSDAMQARIREALVQARRGEFVRFEASRLAKDGSVHDIDFSLKPVCDASGAVVLLIPEGRDVSDLKRAQRAEVAMLRAFAAIGESAALLAHEIKNPITAVHVALRAVAGELGEDHRIILEDLVSRMQRIEQMMRRTLSFTKPLDLRRTECSAAALFADVQSHLQEQVARARAEVRAETPPDDVRFLADRQLLHDVLANLVTNAIEAKPLEATVVLAATQGADGFVTLSVEDDGPGIPESMIDSLFRPFVTTKTKGTGLGLAICRKVVEEHGGTITVERGRAAGARFEIRLPSLREKS